MSITDETIFSDASYYKSGSVGGYINVGVEYDGQTGILRYYDAAEGSGDWPIGFTKYNFFDYIAGGSRDTFAELIEGRLLGSTDAFTLTAPETAFMGTYTRSDSKMTLLSVNPTENGLTAPIYLNVTPTLSYQTGSMTTSDIGTMIEYYTTIGADASEFYYDITNAGTYSFLHYTYGDYTGSDTVFRASDTDWNSSNGYFIMSYLYFDADETYVSMASYPATQSFQYSHPDDYGAHHRYYFDRGLGDTNSYQTTYSKSYYDLYTKTGLDLYLERSVMWRPALTRLNSSYYSPGFTVLTSDLGMWSGLMYPLTAEQVFVDDVVGYTASGTYSFHASSSGTYPIYVGGGEASRYGKKYSMVATSSSMEPEDEKRIGVQLDPVVGLTDDEGFYQIYMQPGTYSGKVSAEIDMHDIGDKLNHAGFLFAFWDSDFDDPLVLTGSDTDGLFWGGACATYTMSDVYWKADQVVDFYTFPLLAIRVTDSDKLTANSITIPGKYGGVSQTGDGAGRISSAECIFLRQDTDEKSMGALLGAIAAQRNVETYMQFADVEFDCIIKSAAVTYEGVKYGRIKIEMEEDYDS